MRWALLASSALSLLPLAARAQWGNLVPQSHFAVPPPTTCPQGNAYNDGCSTAPAATIQFPSMLSGYVTRPRWNVCGVDYGCGIPTGTSLVDPSTISLAGVTVNSSSHTVTITGNNVSLAGIDFGLDNGWELIVNGANSVVRNSHFKVGTNQGSNGTVINMNASASNFSLISSEVDGNNIAVTAQVGATIFLSGSGTVKGQYNYYHNSGGDLIDITNSSPMTYISEQELLKDIGVNTAHADTIQIVNQNFSAGSKITFDTVYQTVDQPAAGNGLLTETGFGSSARIASFDQSNNTVISLPACSHCNTLIGYGQESGATASNVSMRHTYADPRGVNLFTQSPWFPGGKLAYTFGTPQLQYDMTDMTTGAELPQYSASSPGPQGYYQYPDSNGITPSFNDIQSVSASPSSGTVSIGQSVVFTVTLAAEPWAVTGSPYLSLSNGAIATYTSGSGTNVLTFTYTVASGQAVSNLAITGLNAGGSGCTAPIGPSYKLVLDDEFNGTTLDSSKWTKGWFGAGITPPVNSFELQCYGPTQVTVNNGLNLTAISSTNTCGGVSRPYLSGIITSQPSSGPPPLQQFTFGYFEAKVTLPASGGQIANWPAWWLNSQNNPTTGEIDIMEGLSGQACSTFHNSSGQQQICSPANFAGTHVFGALWAAGSITWYYDNVQVGSPVTSGVTSSPMYLVLNNATSNPGDFGGPTVIPANMQASWVHVYQTGGTPVSPQPGYSGPGGCG